MPGIRFRDKQVNTALRIYAHPGPAVRKSGRELQPERDMSHNAGVPAHVHLAGKHGRQPSQTGRTAQRNSAELSHDTAKFDPTSRMTSDAAGIEVGIEYNTDPGLTRTRQCMLA